MQHIPIYLEHNVSSSHSLGTTYLGEENEFFYELIFIFMIHFSITQYVVATLFVPVYSQNHHLYVRYRNHLASHSQILIFSDVFSLSVGHSNA